MHVFRRYRASFLIVFALTGCLASPSAHAAVVWDESVNGDFPSLFPYRIVPLQPGVNEVRGSTGILSLNPPTTDFDRFIIRVPHSTQLTGVTFSATRSAGLVTSITWDLVDARTSTFPLLQQFIGQVPATNQTVLDGRLPLPVGLYNIEERRFFFNGGFPATADYSFQFTVEALPGFSQQLPVLPDAEANRTFVFTNVPSGAWVDPPLVSGFHYEMTTPGSLFTGITGFPTGFSGPFTVSSSGSVLGQFVPGQTLTFPGGGVGSFDVTGIQPLADAADPLAFPLQITFSTPTASFTMQGIETVPEPASFVAWVGLGLLGLAAGARAAVGERVRIVCGALAGLVGTIVKWSAGRRCVLEIEGLPAGVCLIVDAGTVEEVAG